MGERITPQQAAQILGYHPKHVYRLLENGQLPGVKWNGRWELDREQVEALKKRKDRQGFIRW